MALEHQALTRATVRRCIYYGAHRAAQKESHSGRLEVACMYGVTYYGI